MARPKLTRRAIEALVGFTLAVLIMSVTACSTEPEISVPSDVETVGAMLDRAFIEPLGERAVQVIDLERVDEMVGGERSCDGASAWIDEAASARSRIVLAQKFVQVPPAELEAMESEYGVRFCDIAWIAESLTRPHWMVAGEFDHERLDDTLRNDARWAESREIDESGDAVVYRLGDDIAVENQSPYRPLGRGGNLAYLPDDIGGLDLVAIAADGESFDAIVSEPTGLSEQVQFLVERLSGAEGAAMFVTDRIPLASFDLFAQPLGDDEVDLEPGPEPLLPYLWLAAIHGEDSEGLFAEVLLVHLSAVQAETNLERAQAMLAEGVSINRIAWTDLVTVESAGARDNVVLVRLRTGPETVNAPYVTVLQSWFRADTMFAAG